MHLDPTVFGAIDNAVKRQMDLDQIPGLALAVTSRNGLVYQQSYGLASLESGERVRPDHLFEYGSIGKSFTCILLLQLAAERRVAVDRPIADYLPWFEVQSEFEPITLHHLMTHSAGIIRGTDFPADPRYEVWALRDTRAVTPPGERFHYSNVGYKALGLVLERVTGKSYGTLVRERILGPLGMNDTEPEITHDTRKRLPTGYSYFYDDRPWQRSHGHAPATWFETNSADGCIAGTATDLATYLRMLMNGGAAQGVRVLEEESLDSLAAPHIIPGGPDNGAYGYGLHTFTRNGRRFLGHGGGMVGYASQMVADLSTGYGLVTMINGPGRQGPIVDFVMEALHAVSQGEPLPELPPAGPPSIDEPGQYSGAYESDSGRIEVTIGNDVLRLGWNGETIPLEPRDGDSFLARHPDFELFLLKFHRDDDERIASVTNGERVWHAAGQQPARAETPEAWRSLPGHYRSHNPWGTNFRVILRNGWLFIVHPGGHEEPLSPLGNGAFRIGVEDSPEFVRFDTIVDGEAWRAHVSGCDYYRFFTP